MKKILFLLLLPIINFAQSNISNFWKNDSWYIDQIITRKSDSIYIFRIVKQNSDRRKFIYGTFLVFNADGTFRTWNTAPCGNGCFFNSYGTFKKIDETHIQLQINLFSQEGTCIPVTDTIRQNLGIFEIKPNEYGYQLIKTKN
ncbi:MAG: hypothetical protein M3Z80_06890 [Apibacter sp.]|uniref:hypothetical protein n=1 Tax=Apibacter sp. TaxID=2023709 RepID=UPI0025DB097E|nr:hypothetical protein [Apibacter sp.]MCT6869652.1 hypothetical protein [Apibacter sp.]